MTIKGFKEIDQIQVDSDYEEENILIELEQWELVVVKGDLYTQECSKEDSQCEQIVYSRCLIEGKLCNLIIDS